MEKMPLTHDIPTKSSEADALMSASQNQTNGENVQDLDVKMSSLPSPLPQRRLRLNRRGFNLSSNKVQEGIKSLPEEKSSVQTDGHNEGSSSVHHSSKTKDRLSRFSSERKIIKLNAKTNATNMSESSQKFSTHELVQKNNTSNTISLKPRSVFVEKKNVTINIENLNSVEDPPKKKHKPITWP